MNYGAWGSEQGEVANIFDPVSEHMETSAVYPRDALPLGTQIQAHQSCIAFHFTNVTTVNKPIFIVFSLRSSQQMTE